MPDTTVYVLQYTSFILWWYSFIDFKHLAHGLLKYLQLLGQHAWPRPSDLESGGDGRESDRFREEWRNEFGLWSIPFLERILSFPLQSFESLRMYGGGLVVLTKVRHTAEIFQFLEAAERRPHTPIRPQGHLAHIWIGIKERNSLSTGTIQRNTAREDSSRRKRSYLPLLKSYNSQKGLYSNGSTNFQLWYYPYGN